jgi:hypothetical protein
MANVFTKSARKITGSRVPGNTSLMILVLSYVHVGVKREPWELPTGLCTKEEPAHKCTLNGSAHLGLGLAIIDRTMELSLPPIRSRMICAWHH